MTKMVGALIVSLQRANKGPEISDDDDNVAPPQIDFNRYNP